MSSKPVSHTPEQYTAWNEKRLAFLEKWVAAEAKSQSKIEFKFAVTDNSVSPRLDVVFNATQAYEYIKAHPSNRIFDQCVQPFGPIPVGYVSPQTPAEKLQ